ncbi:MAG: GH25 family lysozyme [Candidatus Pristimantibacillus sp.]
MKYKKTVLIVIGLLIALAFAEYKGYIWHNSILAHKYEVRGIDVSHYQGDINWEKVAAERDDFQFVYMKATEGSDYIDRYFKDNWKDAKNTRLLVGAYHFFTTQSTGEQQGDHFIEVVPYEQSNLPPVIDIEIALDHNVQEIQNELIVLSDKMEHYYKLRPILYVTYATFNKYIVNSPEFDDHDIWIRDIVKRPTLKSDRDWLLWQYINRGRVAGIDAYVDINVFNGNLEQFQTRFKS